MLTVQMEVQVQALWEYAGHLKGYTPSAVQDVVLKLILIFPFPSDLQSLGQRLSGVHQAQEQSQRGSLHNGGLRLDEQL